VRFLTPKSRTGMLVRVFAAAILVIGSSAAAVATAALLQVSTIVHIFSVHPGITSPQLTLPKPGRPQTILLIGSDHRAGAASTRDANTDTMLLVRLNAASATINLMSIPRDLKVNVPEQYVPASECSPATVPGDCAEKLNAAYSQGGYSLLIKTIKTNVFPGLHVNHIIDTNFRGFSDLVDAIGCVYTDVDHRYYNISGPGADDYSSIDIQPGYQRLCGDNQSISGALPFVRFRHTDSDFVREARQQDFLRWAKEGYPIGKLLSNRDKLLGIFADHSTLDRTLQTTAGEIELFDLLLSADKHTLKQIPFPASETGVPTSGPDFVYPDSASAEQTVFNEFLRATPSPSSSSSSSSSSSHSSSAHGSSSSRRRHHSAARIDTTGLTADPTDGIAQAKVLTPDMPVYYPRLIQNESQYCSALNPACLDYDEPGTAYEHSYPRQYLVTTPGGKKVHAYFMTIVINAALGEYYGVQGLHWTDPPILADPQATKTFRGRTLSIYEDDSGHVTDVAFREGPDVYWISNTLTSILSGREMIAIAESMTRYRG
jgi:LCP family protein required for cell wall assembly